MQSLAGVLLSGLIPLLSGILIPVASVDYTCEPLKWIDGPSIVSDHFVGTVQDNCRLKALSRGGFVALRKGTEDTIVKGAETIHSGPTSETYSGMPSVLYDVTMYAKKGTTEVRVRGDNHIATDDKNHLVNAFVSTKVSGSGFASYIRESSAYVYVDSTVDPEWFTLKANFKVKVERPIYLPSSTFKDQVKKQLEDEVKDREENLVTKIAEDL